MLSSRNSSGDPGDQGRWSRLCPSVVGADGCGWAVRGNPWTAPEKDAFRLGCQRQTNLSRPQKEIKRDGCRVRDAVWEEKGRLKNLSAKSRMTQWRQSDYFSKPSCRIAACTAGRAAMRSRKAVMLVRPVMSTPTRDAELVTAKR